MTSNPLTPASPVAALPLVGPRTVSLLKRLQITTLGDLLYHFPFRYDDYSQKKKIVQLMVGDTVTVAGAFTDLKLVRLRFGKSLIKGIFADETGTLSITWFNQPYLLSTLKIGQPVFLAGRIEESGGKITLINPTAEEQQHPLHTGRLVPVYPETRGLTSKWLRSRLQAALNACRTTLTREDYLPTAIKKRENFPDLWPALTAIHFPASTIAAERAHRRFAYEEFFLLQLKTLIRQKKWSEKRQAPALKGRPDPAPLRKTLPFSLTADQEKAVAEILLDLRKTTPMNRLLQGDVGSGKTVVAAAAIYAVFREDYRSFYLAPTEILAQQQSATLQELLGPLGVRVHLITGATKPKKRCHLKKVTPLENPPDIIIGTHALFYQDLSKEKLALIVIDEQHRFGVVQRAKLFEGIDAKQTPHLLTMTATPIPRTLALTVFADLSLSTITEMPPGRMPVKTWVVPPEKREAAYNWIKRQLGQTAPTGGQAFVVCPYIEESEVETLKSVRAAVKEFESLQKIFSGYRLGLLHGRLKAAEKESVMTAFREGALDILVATPMVEVGVDIPQAKIMVIEGANHFGLASLHQLRGRVGRGSEQAYCLLFSDSGGPAAVERLKLMERYHQGQKLAEMDLRQRGPGDLYGTVQHGFPKLKIASFADAELIQKTGAAAREIIQQGLDKHPALQSKILTATAEDIKPN